MKLILSAISRVTRAGRSLCVILPHGRRSGLLEDDYVLITVRRLSDEDVERLLMREEESCIGSDDPNQD